MYWWSTYNPNKNPIQENNNKTKTWFFWWSTYNSNSKGVNPHEKSELPKNWESQITITTLTNDARTKIADAINEWAPQ
jgi:hypothetical protein